MNEEVESLLTVALMGGNELGIEILLLRGLELMNQGTMALPF